MLPFLKYRSMLFSAVAFLSINLFCCEAEDFSDENDDVELIVLTKNIDKEPVSKNKKEEVVVKKEKMDHEIKWSGEFSSSGTATAYTALLNNSLPDCTNAIQSDLKLNFDYKLGKKALGHDGLIVHATFRHKSSWGDTSVSTSKESISAFGSSFGAHSHVLSKPPLWVSSAWLDYSFDLLANTQSEGLNRFKIGFVPFSLGRGISLGDSYGVSQDFLGTFIAESDYSMPGMLFYGSTPNKIFNYNLYFARPKARSGSEKDVLGLSRQHVIGASSKFGGMWQDDFIVASQIDFKFKGNDDAVSKKENWSTTLSPYAMYFYSPANKVDVNFDSNINLCTFGFAAEATIYKLSVGFDVAMNRGSQRMLEVDKNSVSLGKDDIDGKLVQQFSHITTAEVDPTNSNNMIPTKVLAVASKQMIEELNKNLHRDGNSFLVDSVSYISKKDRIRSAYKNKYKGYMAIADAELKFDSGLTLSIAGGYASGDKNPHKSETDKSYSGFLGINEAYSPKRVPSMIVLGGKIKRPLTLDEGKEAKLKDHIKSSMTDLIFVGGGIMFEPSALAQYKFKVRTNTLGFWKEYPGFKVAAVIAEDSDRLTLKFSNEAAGRYLGTEINMSGSIDLAENLTLTAKAALFIPGSYYKDITGAVLDNDISKALALDDLDQVSGKTPIRYSIASDKCYIFGIDLKYKF